MIKAIYRKRPFVVQDSFGSSNAHSQSCGIAQGCPLSPYLFIIALTVATKTAKNTFNSKRGSRDGDAMDVTYADDTAVVATNSRATQQYLTILIETAAWLGQRPIWG